MIVKHENVETYWMDYNGQLSYYGIVNIIEAASANALHEANKNNFVMKESYNAAWVITKNKIEFIKNAFWNDLIIIKSFISRVNKITIEIEVIIENKDAEIIAQSKLEFCVIDLEKRRIKKLNDCDINDQTLISESIFNDQFCNIDDTNCIYLKDICVEAMDIDMTLHTNNKDYFKYIFNCYSIIELKREIKSIEIHYLKETKEHDLIKIYKNNNNGDNFMLYLNDKKVSEAKVIWKK